MVIIDTAAVVALLVLVALAVVTGLVAIGIGLSRTYVASKSARTAPALPAAPTFGHLAGAH
jgi:hypothetical protein